MAVKDTKTRKPISKIIQHNILTKARRRCAICYYYNNDVEPKKGQIAHVDRDSSNDKEDNLVFLCLSHHDEYDSKPSQSKGYLKEEVLTAKKELEHNIQINFTEFVNKIPSKNGGLEDDSIKGVSLEVYDRRYPVYDAFRSFLLSILTEVNVDEKERRSFVLAIIDALFLYDKEMEDYLNDVYRHAMKLRSIQRTIKMGGRIDEDKWRQALSEEEEIVLWFEHQLTDGQYLFSKYLRVGP